MSSTDMAAFCATLDSFQAELFLKLMRKERKNGGRGSIFTLAEETPRGKEIKYTIEDMLSYQRARSPFSFLPTYLSISTYEFFNRFIATLVVCSPILCILLLDMFEWYSKLSCTHFEPKFSLSALCISLLQLKFFQIWLWCSCFGFFYAMI